MRNVSPERTESGCPTGTVRIDPVVRKASDWVEEADNIHVALLGLNRV